MTIEIITGDWCTRHDTEKSPKNCPKCHDENRDPTEIWGGTAIRVVVRV